MDKEDFEKYLFISIVPTYTDSLDVVTKSIVIKLDCGNGLMNLEMIICLWLELFYMYPGVSNTTVVSLEADRQYGPIKNKFWINLSECCTERLLHNELLNFAPWMVGWFCLEG